MNVKKSCLLTAALALLIVLFPAARGQSPGAQNPSIEDLISRMQRALQSRDWQAFGDLFVPELREEQRNNIAGYFDYIKMEQVSAYPVRSDLPGGEEPVLYMQAYFQNAYSVIIETWTLTLVRNGDRWEIKKKNVRDNLNNLYKIKIPNERVERAESVEIRHHDIQLTFRDAYVFYDNVPHLDIALVVIGKGHVRFSPSDSREKHQIDLLYKKDALEEKIEYAYLMFSPSFFQNNVTINKAVSVDLKRETDSEVMSNRAYSLFVKYGHRYYSVQNSLTKEPLLFMPQGEDAVISFWGKTLGDFSYIYSPFASEEITLIDNAKGRLVNLYSPVDEKGLKRMFIKFSQMFDVTHCDIDLDFNPDKMFISAKARIDFITRIDSIDTLKFKFDSHLEILRIYDSERRELLYTRDDKGSLLYVYLLDPPVKDQESSLEIYYRGRLEPPPPVTDVAAASQYKDSLPDSSFTTYLYSQSVYWYPFPSGDDYFTSRLRLIVPPGYTCVATGELVEQGNVNNMARVTEIEKVGSAFSVFVSRNPVKYISFLVGKLNKVNELPDPPPLELYTSEMVRYAKKNLLDESRSILRFYEGLFGPFPFSSLKIIQRAWPTAGGHSPASMIILNDYPVSPDASSAFAPFLSAKESPVDLSQWKEYFLAHEIAHQWWGQGLTWSRYRDQWLSEGLAQFASILYLKNKFGQKIFASILRKFSWWTERKSVWGPISFGSRISFFDFSAYQAILYDKSALVLNMLLDMLGEDVFFKGLREFFSSYLSKPALTADFIRIMEKVSGQDLKPFFRKWFDSHLLPEVRVQTSVESRGKEYLFKVQIEQLQEAFVFPLWISWEENGRVRSEKMVVTEKNQGFEFVLTRKPKAVKINPDHALPAKFY